MGSSGDVWITRLGVGFLGVAAVAGPVGAVILALHSIECPAFIVDISKTAAQTLGFLVLGLYAARNQSPPPAGPVPTGGPVH